MGPWFDNIAASIAGGFYPGVIAASLFISPAYADDTQPAPAETGASAPAVVRGTRHANDPGWIAPEAVKKMADWVFNSRDNRGLPFVIVDKPEAKVTNRSEEHT